MESDGARASWEEDEGIGDCSHIGQCVADEGEDDWPRARGTSPVL